MNRPESNQDRSRTLAGGRPRVRGWLAFALVYAVLLTGLVATSSPQETGDAGDYVAMAYNLSHGRPPGLSTSDLFRVKAYFNRWKTGYETYPLSVFTEGGQGGDGRYDTQHFWFYSATVAPVLAVTDAIGVHPNRAFTLVNAVLLLVAAAVVASQLGWLWAALLFAGPIVWWVDKAQTEAFTFSLLAIAMAYVRERPWWSFVCLGAAATQNPPIAGAMAIAIILAGVTYRPWLRRRAFWVGAAVGAALAAIYPLYYLVHLGKLSSFVGVHHGIPTIPELKFPIFDLNYGLVFNAPILCLIVVGILIVVLVRARRSLLAVDVGVAVLSVPVFLIAFAQSPALAAGGTPSMTRYALWLIPLAIPLLSRIGSGVIISWRWLVAPVAASIIWSVAFFAPGRSSADSVQPSPIAAFVWRHYPGLDNPLAEVFRVRESHSFGSLEPTATPSCSKELIVYAEWARCPVGRIPTRCIATPCYANRSGNHYDFVDAPVPPGTRLPPAGAAPPFAAPVQTMATGSGKAFTISGSSIRASSGRRLTIASGAVLGTVDSSEIDGNMAQFSGWAGSKADNRAATAVLLFADGVFRGTALPDVSRPDLAESLRAPGLANAGYAFKLPLDLVQTATQKFNVVLYAIEGQSASRLAFECTSSAQQDFGC